MDENLKTYGGSAAARPDLSFRRRLESLQGFEGLKYCFQCGVCTASCPITRFDPRYNPRRVIRMAMLGLRDELLKEPSLWLCATCFTCIERCPQGVDPAEVIRAIRNLAVREAMPEKYRQLLSTIMETGLAYRMTQAHLRRRERQGLPPLPRVDAEITRRLLASLGLERLVEEGGD